MCMKETIQNKIDLMNNDSYVEKNGSKSQVFSS